MTNTPNETPAEAPEPRYHIGDVVMNRVSKRETCIIGSEYVPALDMTLYYVIERGHRFPDGCGPLPGTGTFIEEVLEPTEQPPFTPEDVLLLTLVYTS